MLLTMSISGIWSSVSSVPYIIVRESPIRHICSYEGSTERTHAIGWVIKVATTFDGVTVDARISSSHLEHIGKISLLKQTRSKSRH